MTNWQLTEDYYVPSQELPKLIGICGSIGSGKDTVGDILIHEYGYTRMSFATTLKDVVAALFGWDREMLEGLTDQARDQRDTPDSFWSEKLGLAWTPRKAMQVIGTDLLRNQFHTDMWLNTVEKKISEMGKVVITDVRFPNEIEWIKTNGDLWSVERGVKPIWFNIAKDWNVGKDKRSYQETVPLQLEGIHESEWAWVGCSPLHKIRNQSTIKDLKSNIRQILFDK
jgi:hypothetical protein